MFQPSAATSIFLISSSCFDVGCAVIVQPSGSGQLSRLGTAYVSAGVPNFELSVRLAALSLTVGTAVLPLMLMEWLTVTARSQSAFCISIFAL